MAQWSHHKNNENISIEMARNYLREMVVSFAEKMSQHFSLVLLFYRKENNLKKNVIKRMFEASRLED